MASTDDAPPSMKEISIIGIWIETLLYGLSCVNCVFFGLCMLTLLRERKVVSRRWVFIVTSTVIFLLCTIHVGASLRQLLEAFAYAPVDEPYYSTIYWLDYNKLPSMMQAQLYTTMALAHGLILVWRFYVVFAHRWKVVLVPIALLTGCMGTGYAGASMYMMHGIDASVTINLIVIAWALGLTLHVLLTGAIVARLWRMDREMDSLTVVPTTNRFTSSIYIIVESSAISMAADTVLMGFVASHSPATMSSMNVVMQVMGLTPFLIIVQVGWYRTSGGGPPVLQDEIVLRVGITQDLLQNPPLHAARSHESSSA